MSEKKETTKVEEKKEAAAKSKTTTKKTATTKSAPKKKVEETVEKKAFDAVKKENKELKKDVEGLQSKLDELSELIKELSSKKEKQESKEKDTDEYRVVHLMSDDNVCELRTTKGVIILRGYEDEVLVDEAQFRDIVREYHNLFAIGFLTTDAKGAKILEQRKINVSHRWLSSEELYGLDKFSDKELEKLYEELHPRQKDRLIEEFLKGVEEEREKGFLDKDKLFVLSKVYDGHRYRRRLEEALIKTTKK